MQASFLAAVLLALPLLAHANERAIARLHEARVGSKPMGSSFAATIFHHDMLVQDIDDPAPLYQARVLRELQFTGACNASLTELSKDQALSDAAETYSTNYDEATASLSNCVETATTYTCTVDGPIEGEAEYQSACTAAGGEMFPIPFDLSCNATFEGEASSLLIDAPNLVTCVPASSDFDSCSEGLKTLLKNTSEVLAFVYELALTAQGFSEVNCSIGEVASSNAATTTGIWFASTTIMAIVGLSLVFGYH